MQKKDLGISIKVVVQLIKKINSIKDFGVFHNFNWNANLDDFKFFNLIYAWNYSGKTTLSRVFQSLERRLIPEDFPKAQFEIELADGQSIHSSNLSNQAINVRVFNTDYVRRQLKWELAESIEPIFVLGEENIELKNKLESLRKEKDEFVCEYRATASRRAEMNASLSKTTSHRAAAMKKELQLIDYNKTKLEKGIHLIKDSYFSNILSEDDYKKNLEITFDSNKKETIRKLQLPNIDWGILHAKCANIVERKVVSNVIKRLEEDPKLNEWVRVGRELHKDEEFCQFCGSKLPSNLMDKLEQHFTDDLNQLLRDIDYTESLITQNIQLLSDISNLLPHQTEFYSDYQHSYVELRKKLDHLFKAAKDHLETLSTSLVEKRSSPFRSIETGAKYVAADDLTKNSSILVSTVQEMNELIEKHNQRTKEFEIVKENAKAKLVKHHIAQFINESDYVNKIRELASLDAALENSSNKITNLENQIKNIEYKLLDASKGAQKINEYLTTFFQSNRLFIDVQDDGRFILKRNRKVARNLSEGEKSAISFIYFITQLEDRNTDLNETIVVIDDPISSLDYNHLHSVFAIIKAKLNPKTCKQLFVSTHNSEFFNLMKDYAISEVPRFFQSGDSAHTEYASFYFIERNYENDEIVSKIIPLPAELKKFKSEYVFLFSLLFKFKSERANDINYRLIIPNVTRRFLESYLNFRTPTTKALMQKLELLITESTDKYLVYKVINEYSHNEFLSNRTFYLPELEECYKVVELILRKLEEKDKTHFDALVSNIS